MVPTTLFKIGKQNKTFSAQDLSNLKKVHGNHIKANHLLYK